VNPSYGHDGFGDSELYPVIPQLGTWASIGHGLSPNIVGGTAWEWTVKSAAVKYGKFYDKWRQNFGLNYSPGYSEPWTQLVYSTFTPEFVRYPYGTDLSPGGSGTKELSARIAIGSMEKNIASMAPSSEEQGLQITATETVDTISISHMDEAKTTPYLGDGQVTLPLWSTDNDFRIYPNSHSLDELWKGTYWTGGYYIQNKGLPYHLRNAVNWDDLGPEPSIGNIKNNALYGGGGTYARFRDGNYGPIPPTMTFGGGGGTWSSALKGTAPYSHYLDWNEETGKLPKYYSNTGKFLECEMIGGKMAGMRVYVLKPSGLTVTSESRVSGRICPEYLVGNELMVLGKGIPDYIEGGFGVFYVDLNVDSRQLVTYDSGAATLEPYYDYFPDVYIPFETNFLLPPEQKIPNYSFNCSDMSGQYSDYDEHIDAAKRLIGAKGPRGYKGEIGCTSSLDENAMVGGTGPKGGRGSQGPAGGGPEGPDGDAGPKGGKGPGGETGPKGSGPAGETGPKGGEGFDGAYGEKGNPFGGTSPAGDQGDEGDKGLGLITGDWGDPSSDDPKNYYVDEAGDIEITLGDIAAGPPSTTIQFTSKMFAVCVEDAISQPNYTGVYLYASDFIA